MVPIIVGSNPTALVEKGSCVFNHFPFFVPIIVGIKLPPHSGKLTKGASQVPWGVQQRWHTADKRMPREEKLMYILRIVTTFLIVLMMLLVGMVMGMRKDEKSAIYGFSMMEIVYALSIVMIWWRW